MLNLALKVNLLFMQGGLEGSVLSYHCSPGQYPHPVRYRLCDADGDWSPMRSASGRRVSQATCRGDVLAGNFLYMHKHYLPIRILLTPPCLPDILCPAQLQLDHGDIWPRNQWFQVGTTQSFSCQEGFTLYGSAQRNCTITGEWTGFTPVCDNHGESGQYVTP